MMMIIMLVKILKKRRFRFPPALFEVLRFFCNSTNPNVIFFQQWSRFHDFLMIFFSRFIFQFQARSVFLYIYLLVCFGRKLLQKKVRPKYSFN